MWAWSRRTIAKCLTWRTCPLLAWHQCIHLLWIQWCNHSQNGGQAGVWYNCDALQLPHPSSWLHQILILGHYAFTVLVQAKACWTVTCSKGIPRFHIPVNQQMYSAQKTGSLFRTESRFDSPRHFVCCTVSVCLQYEKYYYDSDCEDTKLGIIDDIPVEILINYIYIQVYTVHSILSVY